jgi:hypothetical protein
LGIWGYEPNGGRRKTILPEGHWRQRAIFSLTEASVVELRRLETRSCHNYRKKGHLAFVCSEKKRKNFEFKAKNRKIDKNEDESFALNVSNIGDNEEDISRDQAHGVWPRSIEWILDSGCGRHDW